MRSCLQVSISTKLFKRFWHVKGVIFIEYFLTFTSHLSLISRWQRHRDPSPLQDTHRSCWTWSSSCTARCPLRTWTASSWAPAWWKARISYLGNTFSQVGENNLLEDYIHLSSRAVNILAIENAMFPSIYFSSIVPLGILAAMEGPWRLLGHCCVQFFRAFD